MKYLSKFLLPLALVYSSAFAVDMAEFSKLHPAGYTSMIGFASPTIGYASSNHTFTIEFKPVSIIMQNTSQTNKDNKATYPALAVSYKLPVTERLSTGISGVLTKRVALTDITQEKYKKYSQYIIRIPVEYALNTHFAIGVATNIYRNWNTKYDEYNADYSAASTLTDKSTEWFNGAYAYFRYNF